MHNTDRTQLEYGNFETDEYEFEALGLYGEQSNYGEVAMDEIEEMQWATELLAVTNEAELEEFLSNFFRKYAPRLKTAFAPVYNAVKPILKNAAKTAIPLTGQALGSLIGPKSATVGRHLGNAAVDLLGWEVEGMSGEDQSFEVARGVVRFGADAVRRAAATAATGQTSPQALAQAVRGAAQAHAPGLLRPGNAAGANTTGTTRPPTGRWVRRGNKIIILGA
jgi:hypothetical protein